MPRAVACCSACGARGDALRVEVWDTGPGISPDEQQLIFQEFRRGSTAGGQGLGLGLSIAQRMAALLDHPLGLRSVPGPRQRVSSGLCRWPRAVRRAPEPPRRAAQSLPAGRALVVDNEPAALAALGHLLTSWGWQVHAARNAEQALAAPLAAGYSDSRLSSRRRQHRAGRAGPTARQARRGARVMLTADRDGELRQRLLEGGAACCTSRSSRWRCGRCCSG